MICDNNNNNGCMQACMSKSKGVVPIFLYMLISFVTLIVIMMNRKRSRRKMKSQNIYCNGNSVLRVLFILVVVAIASAELRRIEEEREKISFSNNNGAVSSRNKVGKKGMIIIISFLMIWLGCCSGFAFSCYWFSHSKPYSGHMYMYFFQGKRRKRILYYLRDF